MNRKKCLTILICGSILMICGCGKQLQEPAKKLCISNMDKASVMAESEKALSSMNFVVNKLDVEQGYLSTRGLAGGQMFELWKSDNAGSFNSSESNLHSIRRTAELTFSQQDGRVCVDCSVLTERLHLPPKEEEDTSRVFNLFTESGESVQTLNMDEEQMRNMEWIELGNDSALANKILTRIEKRINKKQKDK